MPTITLLLCSVKTFMLQLKIVRCSKSKMKQLLIFALLINSHSTVQAFMEPLEKMHFICFFLLIAPVVLKQAADAVQGVEPLTFSQFFANQQRGQVVFLQRYLHLVRESCILYSLRNQIPFFNLLFMLLESGKCVFFYRHTVECNHH
jgi:hypothetical protein